MHILIVEDTATNRKLLRAQLQAEGFTVLEAVDGLEALEVLECERVDLIISDILMPRMDGYRLCLEVRKSEKLKMIPFIAYTNTYTSPSDEKTALDFGADRFLKRPTPASELLKAIEEVIKNAPHRHLIAVPLLPEPELMKQYNARLVEKLEQKNAELLAQTEELLKAQQQLRLQGTALEMAANAVMITEACGVICWVNPAFSTMTGYEAAEVLGKTPRVLKSDWHEPKFYEDLWRAILSGHTWRGEVLNCRKNGDSYSVEQTITPVRSGDEKAITHFIAIMSDVTEQKRLEEQFIQAQKMEVVGQLAGGVAHDFNNIIAVVMGYSDLITSEPDLDGKIREYVDEIRHAAERAAGLTGQLLVFSRKQTVIPTELDLAEVVKELEQMLGRLIGENIEMKIIPADQIGHIKADSGHIGQVLMNLAVNARDAMPNGGKLTIGTNNVTLAESDTQTGSSPGDYVMLSVSDTGTGMTEKVKARLFEAFFTTKPSGKGSGLGLATCQAIVQQSGGHIGVSSEIGKGTTFQIYFPRIEHPLEITAKLVQIGPLPGGTETLLLVEDDPSVRNLARGVLEARGYEVLSASNGRDGLNVAHTHQGAPIRLLVTDVIMPVMSGKVMAEWLKSIYPDLKILFTSGYTDDAIAHHGVLEPGVEFLGKPYTPATLARKVREMLDASA